ncbi:zinc finger protein DZIP1L [Patagioenas fasciata monilis]|uniref:Zinc finger protein DZIP1L n=1 Tax=Patagioenas fasciata monilis TaxID=372326 RepID=A0A1V4KQV0_PATFA|nr:zinc finger protein DZIP1L [Patagioenas fasciata monilis]
MPFSADTHEPAGMPGVSPGLVIPVDTHPFHFQPRRLGVDWRRFSAIDVERVAREVDVAVLQEHITAITFCNLDGERCPHCGRPADPVLLKVLRMAQLSIEYLLHCQERLGTSLATHAQHLQATRTELARRQEQAAEQAAQLRGAKEESRRWKKLMITQQLLLRAGPSTCCKCHLCDKAFVDGSFLQAHLQRRHPEATEAERQKMKQQVEQMEAEVEELKAKLREMQQQLELQRDREKLRREQEAERARQQEEEGRRDLERWKEEERMKLHGEVDGLRWLFLAAIRDMASRSSSAMEGKLQELQAGEVDTSNLGTLRDDDTDEARWHTWSRAEPRERLAAQLKKENEPLHVNPSQDQREVLERVHQQMDALSTQLRERPKVTKSQEKKAMTWEVTQVVADEEPSARDEAAALTGKRRLLGALQRNPNLLKLFRPILEELLEEKLESMGVKRVAKRISTRTYRNLQALLRLQQQQKAEEFPGLLQLRDELGRVVMGKVRQRKKLSSTLPRHLSVIPDPSPKSPVSLGGSQPMVTPAAAQSKALVIPQPAPRSRTRSLQNPPRSPWGTLRTSKATRPHQGLVPWQRPEAMLGRKKPAPRPRELNPQQEPALSAMVPGDETNSDGSDLDFLEETAGSGTTTSAVTRLLERHLDAVTQRPSHGAKLFPALSSTSPKPSQPARKLQFAGDSSDLDTSLPEDAIESPALAADDALGTTWVPRLAPAARDAWR